MFLTLILTTKQRSNRMPAKNSTLKNGPRHNMIDQKFHKRFCRETGVDVPYKTFVSIIHTSNELIRNSITTNPQGFKFPESMGYACVTRYKPKVGTRSIDWKKSRELGVKVYHTNMHSFGYKPRIGWYTDRLAQCRNLSIYKFVPERTLFRGVSGEMMKGKIYNEYNYDHFKSKKIRLGKIST